MGVSIAQAGLADIFFWAGDWDRAVDLCKQVLPTNHVYEDRRDGRLWPGYGPAGVTRRCGRCSTRHTSWLLRPANCSGRPWWPPPGPKLTG